MPQHRFLLGDAEKALSTLPDNAVQLVVTSPPYGTLKDYGFAGQIGYGETYDVYLNRLHAVWTECVRVLSPGCRVAINVGDQFLSANADGNGKPYQIVPIHADIITQFRYYPEMTYLGGIIWRKITTTNTSGGGSWMGSTYWPRDGHVTYEHEYILLFKKKGKAPRPSTEAREQSRLTKEQRSLWCRGVWDDVAPVRQGVHPAMFPVELPDRLIRMFTFVGETVLDPFVGSGTTLEAAQRAGRWGIGIDNDPKCAELCASRIVGLEAT